MDNINKLLILVIIIAFLAMAFSNSFISTNATNMATSMATNISSDFAQNIEKTSNNFSQTVEKIMVSNKNLTSVHPYNQCIKLLIDQVNHEESKANFKEIKSVCFELMKEENQSK